MNIKIKSIALATMTYVLSTSLTQAALITTNMMSVSDDFSNFGDFMTFGSFIPPSEPVTLASGATWASEYNDSLIGNGYYSLKEGINGNGYWDVGRNGFTGLAIDGGSMTFSFESDVNYVGGFMNYYSSTNFDVKIEAIARDERVLESYIINDQVSDPLAFISTPGGINDGAFRGILRDTSDIAAFRVSNGYAVLDDLTFGTAAVPVPAAMWLFGSVLLGLVAVARRKARA